ncbi:MAG: HD domain-containing protein [Candidatus Wallbacteria bacterium]|nr:HD domain-containing protein [Candidatus Wallbacteria bacterium]
MFKIPIHGNEKLQKIYDIAAADIELQTYWEAANVVAIDRLHLNDHGRVHVTIVTNIAMKLLRMLHENGVQTSIEKDHGLTYQDSEVVLFLACILHDIGHIVHRDHHSFFGAAMAPMFLERMITGLYPPEHKARIIADVCHAIFTHREEAVPLTIEAGALRVADALDMKRGRARISFSEIGSTSIHTVSAYAIKEVSIEKGDEKPIKIKILMANSSGIFQIDSLLKHKLKNSGIEQWVEVYAFIEGEVEEKIINIVRY